MNNDFRQLLILQEIDMRIIDLEKSKEEFPAEVELLETDITNAVAYISSQEERISDLRTEKKKNEIQIDDTKIALDKSQDRLNSIKTNREYDAVHTEIESQKQIVANSDKMLNKFTSEINAQEKNLEDSQEALKELRIKSQPRIDELKDKIAHIDSNIEAVLVERKATIPNIAKRIYRHYDHIRKNQAEGEIVGVVTLAERICTICFQRLQPQVIDSIRRGMDLVDCQNCGSILIWNDNMPKGQ